MTRRRGTVVRDPVHGDIQLSGEELDLLDTAAMQRLRGVRQLGTAYLVYPGAQHTRFEHSLGTLHMTGRLIAAINRNRRQRPSERIGVAEDEARILRVAALVHDVTHIPFGHNIEDQSGIIERHDSAPRFLRALASDTELGQLLDAMGVRREVLAVLLPPDSANLPNVPHYWREILSDTICADILDYLRRDAYYTGLNLQYDDRVVQYFSVDRASGHLYVDLSKRGLIRQDILSELVRVLDARYFFSERVYYHHAKIAAGAIIAQAVQNAIIHGGMPVEALYERTDDGLLLLLDEFMPDDEQVAARQHELIDRFRRRRLLKRAAVYPRYANVDVQDRLLDRFFAPARHRPRAEFERQLELSIAERVGVRPLVVLYCPARHMQLKEAQTHVRLPGEDGPRPLASLGKLISRLADLEDAYRDLWKLYVLVGSDEPAVLTAAAEAAAELLPEATSAYRPAET